MSSLRLLAAADGPHISLRAEPLFELAGFTITNSILYGLVLGLVLALALSRLAKHARPRATNPFLLVVEMGMEFIRGMLLNLFQNEQKASKYTPVFSVFFFFILLTNIAGLLPIVGHGITINDTIAFRPFTADLNATLAMAAVAIVTVQYYSIKEQGLGGHLKHYFTSKPFSPINFMVGLIEIFGELTRIASLALRLFINTAVGEILIAIFIFIGQSGTPLTILPIIIFEILVALIQAYVFTLLSATYLSLAIAHHDEHHESDEPSTDLDAIALNPSGSSASR